MGTYLTKGTTFTTGDTVTAGSLNNLVDNATVTAGSIGSTELGANSVTADKISTSAPQPVTTSTIRDNAVDNTKLNNMGSQTVKVNDTNGTANPTDLGMIGGGTNGSSKILMGTSDSLSVLTATQFKMVDASDVDAFDSTATKLRLNTTAIDDWDTVALATDVHDDNDRLLIYDADGVSPSVASLKQISPKKLIQSLPAGTGASGVCALATATELIDPSGADANDVISAATGALMLTKAYGEFVSTIGSSHPTAQTIVNGFNISTISRTAEGVFDIVFSTAFPSTKYIVIATGYTLSNENLLFGRITAKTASGCTVKFGQYDNVLADKDPSGVATLVFYGLTS
jgi:hypothetical protein